MRGDIKKITFVTEDGEWLIDSSDEYIYSIRFLSRRNMYKVKTIDRDYYIDSGIVKNIIVEYYEEY